MVVLFPKKVVSQSRHNLLQQKIVNRMCLRPYFINHFIKLFVQNVPRCFSNVLYAAKYHHVEYVDWLIKQNITKQLDDFIHRLDYELGSIVNKIEDPKNINKERDILVYVVLLDTGNYLFDILLMFKDLEEDMKYGSQRDL